MRNIDIEVPQIFVDYIENWDYEKYFVVGGYGTGKSYQTALKLIIKLMKEKRKALVVRDVYTTLRESCWDLIYEILDKMELVTIGSGREERRGKVYAKTSPLSFEFSNGSRIIFKGMDRPGRAKSLNGVSIVWIEECSEIKVSAYRELLGRVRTPGQSMHFIMTTNPVGKDNWTWKEFFEYTDEKMKVHIIQDDEKMYRKKKVANKNTYYLHSVPDDNPFLPVEYIERLDELKEYDPDMYRIARQGRYGLNGRRVLPNLEIATDPRTFKAAVRAIPDRFRRIGMDFGFEESSNAVIKMAIDDKNKYLYLYDEYYRNKMTDPETAVALEAWDPKIKEKVIRADEAEPKTIRFYQQSGFRMYKATKGQGSRLENTKKMKRFRKIIVSPKCRNAIRELKDLTYALDPGGNPIYDQFNIDPHLFSAAWYGLDGYEVADMKERKTNSY